MVIDASTLRDLAIVPAPGRHETTLWSMVDRTRTRAGAQALRQRLLEPPSTAPEATVALQQAQKMLATEPAYRVLLDRADLNGVEKYLAVTWQLPESMPPLARFRRWYREYEREVARGQQCVASLLGAAANLGERLSAAPAPPLRDVGEALAMLLDTATMRELDGLAGGSSVRAFDQMARGRLKSKLLDIVERLATVEALWSLGTATIEHGWSYPQPAKTLRAVGLVHPFLAAEAVRNDLQLKESVRVCFVTGPNMAGKSTFLKAVAIAVLLAHAGCGVPAASMEFPVVTTLFSSINIEDDLGRGESYYLAEVRRIAALARALCDGGTAVAVLDEPFRGTNVHDAVEATLAVVTRLASHPAAAVFVASHLGEIVPAIAGNPGIALFHFAADVAGDVPSFDYRLRDGVSHQRLGMSLLRQEGVLELLDGGGRYERSKG